MSDDEIESKTSNEPNILDTLKEFLTNNDNTKNIIYASDVPQICKETPCLLGVDEAGRGPVLGPMVYGVAYCPIEKNDDLKTLKCADSKTLNELQRNNLLVEISSASDYIGWVVELNSPNFISNSMLSPVKTTLNEVALQSTFRLIQKVLDAGVNLTEVYVDTLGPPDKHRENLRKRFGTKIKFRVEKKADSLFPIVSAASICAKVTRDHALKVWKFPEEIESDYKEFGSGYPNDPLTKKFLVKHMDPVFGYPQLVRFSWSTAEKILHNSAVKVTWPEVDEDEVKPKKTKVDKSKKEEAPKTKSKKITSFFAPQKKKMENTEEKIEIDLPNFFIERSLSSVESL
ncbi:ribonuclease H2 subunit A [Chrysoperla carnea]|uniref:ribonuclease H2 subunit A n=1 Tax=Chrysoperla carnea TaxID=189513 RepID=UPI001D083F1D|nr:ribonuclease H2 subunit A [Chrysoperla carnea]